MPRALSSPPRSWLFAPGHNRRILEKAFGAGADEVLLDLEDGVGPNFKAEARAAVVEVLSRSPAWVRINPPGTAEAERDLEAVAALAKGIRIPKVSSAADLEWVRDRLRGRELPLTASIESALGVANAASIAAGGIRNLTFGNLDLAASLGVDPTDQQASLLARSTLVLASAAAGIEPPSDGVYADYRDRAGLAEACAFARRLGFAGKSAIHPDQVAVINEAFTPSAEELTWAREVVDAYAASGGAATSVGGEMVDVPVYERARLLLRRAGAE